MNQFLYRIIFTFAGIIVITLLSFSCHAEKLVKTVGMSPEKLYSTIQQYSSEVDISNNLITFKYKNVALYCIWDANADRMRIVSPIAKIPELDQELLTLALKANYHTVLDARYAIGDDVLYAAFIHPLSSITQLEIESAIRQVATANLTFGTSFSSGELVFPGNDSEQQKKPKGQSM